MYNKTITIEQVEELIDERLDSYKEEIAELKNKIIELEKDLADNTDSSDVINIKERNLAHFGSGYITSVHQPNQTGVGTRDSLFLAAGNSREELFDAQFQITKNSAIGLLEVEKNASYLVGESSRSVVNLTGNATISGSVITDTKLNLIDNYFNSNGKNHVCSVFDSEGNFDSVGIVSNTKNTITLAETPTINGKTLSGSVKYSILSTLYLGFSNQPFQRAYVQDGLAGGLRFGPGPTGKGRNAFLYVDGDNLKFRNKSGTTTTIA